MKDDGVGSFHSLIILVFMVLSFCVIPLPEIKVSISKRDGLTGAIGTAIDKVVMFRTDSETSLLVSFNWM